MVLSWLIRKKKFVKKKKSSVNMTKQSLMLKFKTRKSMMTALEMFIVDFLLDYLPKSVSEQPTLQFIPLNSSFSRRSGSEVARWV